MRLLVYFMHDRLYTMCISDHVRMPILSVLVCEHEQKVGKSREKMQLKDILLQSFLVQLATKGVVSQFCAKILCQPRILTIFSHQVEAAAIVLQSSSQEVV